MNSSIRFKLFLMMVLEIAIWGAWQVQIFNYMPLLKFEGWQMNLAGSMFAIASVVGIFFSNQFADRNFAAEKFLAFSHLVGGVALIGAGLMRDFWPFFACFLLYGLFYVPTISVTNSLAFANLKDPAKDFGFVRMGGTIGSIVVSWPLVFLLDAKSTVEQMRWIFFVGAIISFVLAAFSLTLPHTPPRKDVEGGEKLAWVKAIKLLGLPYVLVLFFVTLIDSTIHNGYFVLIGGFLQGAIKMPDNWISAVTTIGQVAEIVTMLILGSVLKRLGWKLTMLIGIMGHLARFLVFSFFTKPEHMGLIIAVQVLHGICYAFFFATLYIWVDAVFPKDIRTGAQGLFNLLVLGAGLVIANFWFGSYKASVTTADGLVDYHKLFLLPSGLALAACVLLALFFKPPTARPEEVGASKAAH